MKKLLPLVLITILFISCSPSKANNEVLRTINVSGYGSIEVEPDYVTLMITISTKDPSPRISQAKNSEASIETIAVLKELGVDAKWVSTISYNLQEYTKYNRQMERYELAGYQTIHNLQVRIEQVESLSEVLSSLLEKGVSSINSFEYGIENYLETQNLVLQKAVEAARVKAQSMIEGQGLKLGLIISVVANTSNSPSVGSIINQNMSVSRVGGSESSLATGARYVRATISAQFELILGNK